MRFLYSVSSEGKFRCAMWPMVSKLEGISLVSTGNTAFSMWGMVQWWYSSVNWWSITTPPSKATSSTSPALNGVPPTEEGVKSNNLSPWYKRIQNYFLYSTKFNIILHTHTHTHTRMHAHQAVIKVATLSGKGCEIKGDFSFTDTMKTSYNCTVLFDIW